MFTIIGGDGKEYGPVSAEQIRTWLAGGRANLDTKAKAQGSEEWRRIGDFPDFSGSPSRVETPPTVAVNVADAKAYAEDLISRGSTIDVMGCLGRSFELWKAHFLPLVGVTLLIVVAQGVAGMIPVLGMLSGLLLNGVFYGGLYYFYLGKIRGEHREVGDAFAGFTRAFVPLMLATLVSSLIIIGVMMVACAPLMLWLVKSLIEGGGQIRSMPAFSPFVVAGGLVGCVAVIYLSISWAFTFLLVIDQGLGPWTAMQVGRRVVGRHWFAVFGVLFLGAIFALLGIVALFIGIIFTLPLMFGAICYAYESLFRPPPRI
ncbi:MAG: hypothetical protein JWM88_581 [Verrucomicrobia bacterium]|nr:hypothetical protein [Verrucomicrobiota bacterium]